MKRFFSSIVMIVVVLSSLAQNVFYDSLAVANAPLGGKALNHYLLARDGDPEAQYLLASCYKDGYGVAANDTLALYWGRKSAQQNHPAGLYFLAYCYETAKGVSRNTGNSEQLYKLAFDVALPLANRGDASSQFVVGKIFDYGNGGVKQNQETAVRWYTRAADQGYAGAQFNLGSCFELGEGVNQDKQQAAYWYRQAANQGDTDAQYTLGLCYATGEGVPKSASTAINWFIKAARQGNRLAQQVLLGIGREW